MTTVAASAQSPRSASAETPLGELWLPREFWQPLRDWMAPDALLGGAVPAELEVGSLRLRVAIKTDEALVRLRAATLAVLDQSAELREAFEQMWSQSDLEERLGELIDQGGAGESIAGLRSAFRSAVRPALVCRERHDDGGDTDEA